MKVTGPGRSQGPSSTKKTGKASSSEGSFGDFIASGPSETGNVQHTRNIAQVDALLAIQGAEDPTARAAKKRMRQRSHDLLDGLDKIRTAMLCGNLTVGHMIDIADVVASHREKITDPGLTSIMDEIDLRAQVELAKMRVALDAQAAQKASHAEA
ncbi:MAG: flagellar assembly protein FliX [Alphaproteobacteria bacterium]|nr:flagellar assembly protein FliX [Alphaproteobacteria bacterium]